VRRPRGLLALDVIAMGFIAFQVYHGSVFWMAAGLVILYLYSCVIEHSMYRQRQEIDALTQNLTLLTEMLRTAMHTAQRQATWAKEDDGR
jgi:hypothetical protein